jgi:hypothetical protein
MHDTKQDAAVPKPIVVEVMDDAMADVLRAKTEVERLRIAGRMWKSARAILRGAIRTEHPEWDAVQVNREIAWRISHGGVERGSR